MSYIVKSYQKQFQSEVAFLFWEISIWIPINWYRYFTYQNVRGYWTDINIEQTPCADGKYRPITYATKKGLEYIRKLLRKNGYYDLATE